MSQWVSRRTFMWFSVASLASIGLGAGSATVLAPKIREDRAREELKRVIESKGEITLVNSTLYDFQGDSKTKAKEHKALGDSTGSYPNSCFHFSNLKPVVEGKKILEVYANLSSPYFRDFLALNMSTIGSLIEYGDIELKLYPVVSDSFFSSYAPEAMSHLALSKPELVWSFLADLIKLSNALYNDKVESGDEVLGRIVEELKKYDSELSVEKLSSGMFSSWIYSTSTLKEVTGESLPLVLIDGESVPQNDINNSSALKELLVS